jgi:hypothetical protein
MDKLKHYLICENECLVEGMTKEETITAIAEATGYTPTETDNAFISKVINQNKGGNLKFWKGTRAERNAVETAEDTVYVVEDDKTPNEAYEIAKEAQIIAEDASARAYGTMSLKKVWTNENPSGTFADQTVDLYLANADMVMVEHENGTSIVSVGSSGILLNFTALSFGYYRKFDVTETGVRFYTGYKYENANATVINNVCKPTAIYTMSAGSSGASASISGGESSVAVVNGIVKAVSTVEGLTIVGVASMKSDEILETINAGKAVFFIAEANTTYGTPAIVATYDAYTSMVYQQTGRNVAVFTSYSVEMNTHILIGVDENGTFSVEMRQVSGLPEATADDAGKFLRLNDSGVAEWQSVPSAEGVSF